MNVRRVLASAGAAVLVASGLVMAGASPASADQVWEQQVQRSSADATCDIPSVEGDAAGWSGWAPSWAQWPNDGKGGFVCERSITWAKDTPPPGPGCVLLSVVIPSDFYVQFASSNVLPVGTPIYLDAACTPPPSGFATISIFIFAPDEAAALALCPLTRVEQWSLSFNGDPQVWICL